MPIDRLYNFGGGRGAANVITPFSLISTSVSPDGIGVASKDDFDCACPCNALTPTAFITSSELFSYPDREDPVETQNEEDNGEDDTGKSKNKTAIKVNPKSYLFKGILPPRDLNDSDNNVTQNKLDADPTYKIYGLGGAVIVEDFLPDVKLADGVEDYRTLKFWLTCCYASGEASYDNSNFDNCTGYLDDPDGGMVEGVDEDNAANDDDGPTQEERILCSYAKSTPQVVFISAGLYWPKNLVVRKFVNKGTPAKPLIDKRVIEAHVPIGEVNSAGTVVHQILKSNLVLTDMCISGVPIKFPTSIFSEYR